MCICIHDCSQFFCNQNYLLTPSFFALPSGTRGLMHSRGFTLTRFWGRTETAASNDPLGTPERGSSSTRTESWQIYMISENMVEIRQKNKYIYFLTSVNWWEDSCLWRFEINRWIWYSFFNYRSHNFKAFISVQQRTHIRILHMLCLRFFNTSSVITNCKLQIKGLTTVNG